MCVEDSMRQNCPVCFEYLFDSVRPTAVLPCGHTIHSECLKDMEKNRQLLCPICMKTYADLAPIWRRIDQEVADTPMPPDYANWIAHILCNDCNQVRVASWEACTDLHMAPSIWICKLCVSQQSTCPASFASIAAAP